MTRIGVISDTHGLLRPEALDALSGSDLIIHAGDIGPRSILDQLAEIAPVTAVRGNVDRDGWCSELKLDEVVEVDARTLYVIHDLGTLQLDPAAAGFDMVIFGHSHRPDISEREGVTYLNPGSAGPKRFSLPVSVATLAVSKTGIEARLIQLQV